MRTALLILALLFSVSANSDEKAYCSRSFADFQKLALRPDSRIAFENEGGLLDGGVCWWHSKLQRLAVYLADYAPWEPKPNQKVASSILISLIDGQVARIPGYRNFHDFSADFRELIQSRLELWQKWEGAVEFGWVTGLKGKTWRDPAEFASAMNRLYLEVHDWHEIEFVLLQIQGISSHAWLIVGMERIPNGYRLQYIDSNDPEETGEWDYHFGDYSVGVRGSAETAGLFEEFTGAIGKIQRGFRAYCGRELQ